MKFKIKQCVCGRIFNRHTGDWMSADKMQQETIKDRVKKGLAEIEIHHCVNCKKGGQL